MQTTKTQNIRLILVDDHQIVRDGIKMLLGGIKHFEVVGEAGSAAHLFALLKSVAADVVLLDINLPDISGIEVTRRLKESHPDIAVLILSMYNSEDYIFNAVRAGAKAYLPKTTSQQELEEAVNTLYRGGEYFSSSISNVILHSFIRQAKDDDHKKENSLTARETEILRLFAQGMSNPEIADQLFISVRTVESHKNHIMQKLALRTTVDLVKFAIRSGIIEI